MLAKKDSGFLNRLRKARAWATKTSSSQTPNSNSAESTISPSQTPNITSAEPTVIDSELDILRRFSIPLSATFDVNKSPVPHFRDIMKELGKTVATNAHPCAKGHTIRTRANHCLVCNPQNIGFLNQYVGSGCIYVANSRSNGLVKIGISHDPKTREKSLRAQRYGGVSDWWVICHVELDARVGELEAEVHAALTPYSCPRKYKISGHEVICREIFNCEHELATSVLMESAKKYAILSEWYY